MHFCSDVNNCLSFLHSTRFHFQKCIFKMHKTPNFPYQGYCLCGGMQAPLRCCEIPFLEKIEPWGRHSQFKLGLEGVNTKKSFGQTLTNNFNFQKVLDVALKRQSFKKTTYKDFMSKYFVQFYSKTKTYNFQF